MKALTIYQPWASLVIEGAKPYEFRGWPPPAKMIGQRIVIHASSKAIDRALVEGMYEMQALNAPMAREMCLHRDKAIPVLARAVTRQINNECGLIDVSKHGDLPWGCGLGTAVIGEPRRGDEIAEEFGMPRANDSDRDQHANWGWPMLEIEKWDEPIEMRGMQGLWTWPEPKEFIL